MGRAQHDRAGASSAICVAVFKRSESLNHYQTLGVSPDADPIVIRAAYRALSQRYHPDKCQPGERAAAHRRMSEINKAFEVLGDPSLRSEYDRQRTAAAFGNEASGDASGGQNAPMHRHSSQGTRRLEILTVTTLLILEWGVEKKPWWQWTWEFLLSGLDRPSHYAFNWPVILVMLGIGVFLALRSGRNST